MTSIGCNLRITAFCSKGKHTNLYSLKKKATYTKFGCLFVLGGRKYMEDYFSVAYQQSPDGSDLEFAYFGIFDGHGGNEASKFAKEHLMNHIVNLKGFWSDDDEDVKKAIREGFLSTHHAMWKDLDKWPKTNSGLPSTAGTTASIAFIRRGKIYIGHCGDSGIVLGKENSDGRNGWVSQPLTVDHKPESEEELSRITSVGGKVINKGGVHRVVWNRAKYGHKGPIRRSTPIDEIPFLAVARSLGDLWSYNPRNDEFVVSPEPDVSVVKIDSDTFKCLIFGTDGLWNMMSSADSVDIVRSAEMLNDANINDGNTNEWKNPSRCLVDEALDRWQSSRMRADNTSVVTIMLDRPNKKNMLKICRSPQTTLAESGFGDQSQSQSQVAEEGNHTMFDYSTSESYDLDEMPTLKRADATLGQKSDESGFYYDNTTAEYLPSYHPPTPGAEIPSTSSGYFGEPYSSMYQSNSSYCNQPTGVPRYEPSSFLHQQLSTNNPSPYLPDTYSLTKLETKTERLEGHHHIYGVTFIRQPPQPTPPAMPSYSHTPLTYQQPEMNVLPSLQPNLHDHHHNLQSNYNKFSMERYDYVPAEPSSSFVSNQNYEQKCPAEVDAESDSDDDDDEDDDDEDDDDGEEEDSLDLTISETMNEEVTESVVKVEENIADELIQINEISSSFNENDKTKTLNKTQLAEISKENNNNNNNNNNHSNNKENSVEKTLRSSVDKKSSRNVSQPTQNYRKIYVTRQMNRKTLPTSTNKNMAKEPSQRRISKRKVAKVMSEVKQPVTATVIRKMVNIVTLVTRNQQPPKNVVDVKSNVRILRNTKLSIPVVVNVVTQPNKSIPEQTASKVKVLIAKTLRSSKNIMKPSAPVIEKKPLLRKSRNQENTSMAKSKLRKIK
ncbi:unnamed protein product [Diamesa serratosioi]